MNIPNNQHAPAIAAAERAVITQRATWTAATERVVSAARAVDACVEMRAPYTSALYEPVGSPSLFDRFTELRAALDALSTR